MAMRYMLLLVDTRFSSLRRVAGSLEYSAWRGRREIRVRSGAWPLHVTGGSRPCIAGSEGRGPLLEFTVRHWSNAWLKPPNRAQNF